MTVERPLRLKVDLSVAKRKAFRVVCADAGEEPISNLADELSKTLGSGPHTDFNIFSAKLADLADAKTLSSPGSGQSSCKLPAERDESAEPVIKGVHKAGKAEVDPMHGLYKANVSGKPVVVEYEPDTDLRDTEQVPLLEEGGIDGFIEREVLPHAPDAWVDEDATKIGYEINFNRHFYKPQPLRSLDDIRKDILAVEKETDGLLAEIIGGTL